MLVERLSAIGFTAEEFELAAIAGATTAMINVAPRIVGKAVLDLMFFSKDFTLKTPFINVLKKRMGDAQPILIYLITWLF